MNFLDDDRRHMKVALVILLCLLYPVYLIRSRFERGDERQ